MAERLTPRTSNLEPCDELASRPKGRSKAPRHASCQGNRDKLRPLGLWLVWRALYILTLPFKKISLDGRQLLFVKVPRGRQIVWRRKLYIDRGKQGFSSEMF